jgi:putative MFS transporter
MTSIAPRAPLTSEQRKLFVFLGVATFFEGFDGMALAQILPALRADMGIGEWATGALVAFVNIGTVLAYFLVRLADRWGRKPVLDVTIAGYIVSSFLCGLAPNVVAFAVFQLFARVFLVGEWVISSIYVAEEFPAERRGAVLGVIGAFASLGAILCAAIVPLLSRLPWGWRTVYLLAAPTLVVIAIARRGLRETARFERLTAEERRPSDLLAVMRTPYRTRIFQLATIWIAITVCTQTAITFWKQHAVESLGIPETTVGLVISAAAVVAMPAVFASGRFLDRVGRRRGTAALLTAVSAGCVIAYTQSSLVLLFVAVVLMIFGASSVPIAVSSLSTELFPTAIRAEAFGWSNSVLGRVGFVLGPIAVGAAAESIGWGPAVCLTALGPMIALVLVLRWMPETSGRELEETAAL